MYQATDSRQRRRQRQKGSSPVPGNKRMNADVYISPVVPAKRIFVVPQYEVPPRISRDTPRFLISRIHEIDELQKHCHRPSALFCITLYILLTKNLIS
jgi:hypothetical protein